MSTGPAVITAKPKQGLHLPKARASRVPGKYLQLFLLLQFACQLALLSSLFGPVRVALRTAALGASLLLLATVKGPGRAHPARQMALWVMAVLTAALLHPSMNTLAAGLAEIFLNLAVIAPLFWVPRLSLDFRTLRQVLLILWLFNSCSAAVGVLQTAYPGQFQPNLTSNLAGQDQEYLDSLMIQTATGEKVFRPMGLTDQPGGAAMSGFYAILLGVGFLLTESRLLIRATCLGSMMLGLAALLMSQVRSVLLMLCCCLIVLLGLLLRRGEGKRLAALGVALAGVSAIGFAGAVMLAGESVTSRLSSLTEEDAGSVYEKNRGHFLQDTVDTLLPEYPLGAGLGRWGMMNAYFGDNSDPERAIIWAEIQWTGWLLDGGAPLILAYSAALGLTLWTTWKIAIRRKKTDQLWLWGSVLFAHGIGAVAMTFNYPLFAGQGGMEFWLLHAALFSTAQRYVQAPTPSASLRLPAAGARG